MRQRLAAGLRRLGAVAEGMLQLFTAELDEGGYLPGVEGVGHAGASSSIDKGEERRQAASLVWSSFILQLSATKGRRAGGRRLLGLTSTALVRGGMPMLPARQGLCSGFLKLGTPSCSSVHPVKASTTASGPSTWPPKKRAAIFRCGMLRLNRRAVLPGSLQPTLLLLEPLCLARL